MKVSLNWLREFLDIDKKPEEIADILTSLGLEVEGWERVSPSPVDLERVLTGKVIACARIPKSDHLSAIQVDVGDGQLRSIVCGAPNVAEGQCVLVALPGARVLGKDGQPFEISERRVRGVLSQGMICAEDELGLGSDHSGILVLPEETPLGLTAAEYLGLRTDVVFEIGLTPNRADATSHLGVASDLLAWIRYRENPNAQLRMPNFLPDWPEGLGSYAVSIENTQACQRYIALLIRNVCVQDSPTWLQQRLLALGQRPINNIVDITNYVRLELGHPLHAFDASRIGGNGLRVMTLPEGTPFITLDGERRQLSAEDLMICDAAGHPLCIAGVFGGAESGVTDQTTDILLECASFHPTWIRRTMLRHGLRTDAAWTFEKGVDPNGCLRAMKRAATLVLELAGGQVASSITDLYPVLRHPARVPVTYAYVRALSGAHLSAHTIERILTALDIGIEDKNDVGFTAVVPTNKPDVTRPADVVEEILRIYGLDEIPVPTLMRTSIEATRHPTREYVRRCLADYLAANGFLECMSLSLTQSAYYTGPRALLPLPHEQLVFVHNTANQGLDCMRPTLLFSALENARHNQSHQHYSLRLFEFGKVYRAPLNENSESEHLSLLLCGAHSPESWQPAPKEQADFYTLKAYVDNLLKRIGLSCSQETALIQEAPFRCAARYQLGHQTVATFGEVAPALVRAFDLRGPVFYAELHFDALWQAATNHKVLYIEPSKFPSVRRDLALILDHSVTFAQVRQVAFDTEKKLLQEVNLFDVFEDEQKIGPGKKSYAISFLFESTERTLQSKEIDAIMQRLQEAFEQQLRAIIRK
ncbi:MAG: phenylalanine--tRNA ligase subunit beta [Saprospiraceae bacterium]|nr:phenylalanine--tRNA ligase subunit beta [Saprospiraceae bacterium]MDW8484376.1 phenylalanine--tRNA ligase subunit beta [Saprospiraceae bacterium]